MRAVHTRRTAVQQAVRLKVSLDGIVPTTRSAVASRSSMPMRSCRLDVISRGSLTLSVLAMVSTLTHAISQRRCVGDHD